MTAADLAARIESADECQTWEMLRAAFGIAFPAPYIGHGDIPLEWDSKVRQFKIFQDANAPYDAAKMLVKDGWLIVSLSELGGAGGCSCTLGNPGTGESAQSDHGARTIPFAIAAAAVRAGG